MSVELRTIPLLAIRVKACPVECVNNTYEVVNIDGKREDVPYLNTDLNDILHAGRCKDPVTLEPLDSDLAILSSGDPRIKSNCFNVDSIQAVYNSGLPLQNPVGPAAPGFKPRVFRCMF